MCPPTLPVAPSNVAVYSNSLPGNTSSVIVANIIALLTVYEENTNYGPNWKRPTLILDGRLVKFGGQLSF
jgi:hypothetical protein